MVILFNKVPTKWFQHYLQLLVRSGRRQSSEREGSLHYHHIRIGFLFTDNLINMMSCWWWIKWRNKSFTENLFSLFVFLPPFLTRKCTGFMVCYSLVSCLNKFIVFFSVCLFLGAYSLMGNLKFFFLFVCLGAIWYARIIPSHHSLFPFTQNGARVFSPSWLFHLILGLGYIVHV